MRNTSCSTAAAARGPIANRHKNFYIMHCLARPTMAADSLVSFVLGGVFERHPKLKVGFFECSASWMLYWMERMEFGYDNLKPDYAPYLKLRPSEYVRRNVRVTPFWHENLPLLGFLVAGGKCRGCGLPISRRLRSVTLVGVISTSAGNTLAPPLTIMSFRRSTT